MQNNIDKFRVLNPEIKENIKSAHDNLLSEIKDKYYELLRDNKLDPHTHRPNVVISDDGRIHIQAINITK